MKDLKKYFLLAATPIQVYNALTNPTIIQLWTGEDADMSNIPGSEFSLWDGSISGKNLEFEEGKKLVQQWYFGEQQEPSIVTFKFHESSVGTSVELRHTNIPDDAFDDIEDGWNTTYFGSLQQFFEE